MLLLFEHIFLCVKIDPERYVDSRLASQVIYLGRQTCVRGLLSVPDSENHELVIPAFAAGDDHCPEWRVPLEDDGCMALASAAALETPRLLLDGDCGSWPVHLDLLGHSFDDGLIRQPFV
ncbi:MAG: hypothetical protein JWP06_464 [Candidatus Saccharibacteria bacterium]|nr:hypothetical protein [Candidatus Saccharibacteria bacterium]